MEVNILLFIYCTIITLYLIQKIFTSKTNNNNNLVKDLMQEIENLKNVNNNQNKQQNSQITQIKQHFTELTQIQDDFQKKLLNTQIKLMQHVNKTYSQRTNSQHNNSVLSQRDQSIEEK
ncbi:unnamed protein product [Paramecium octaurelia]|uniref:Uncharacterized protein n=1 Tax=Paramecium octaurelia TaxID=43137 RepID=A0A8S1X2K8_PAROT|nr:unnamed protein product [Paramecium octaurelia]